MKQDYRINCQVGDIINYYTTMRLSNYYKAEKDPTEIIVDININDIREHTSHVIITDGFINEFDNAELDPTTNELILRKKVKICGNATYAIHVIYTKASSVFTGVRTYLYMNDLSMIDEIYNTIPNDIYFW